MKDQIQTASGSVCSVMSEANLQALRRDAWRYGEMRHPELIALWLVATQIHFRCSQIFRVY